MPAGFRQVPAAGLQFGVDVLEREVGRVNLAVRVRVADADDFSLVLEDEDERHIGICGQFTHLLLPRLEQRVDAIDLELGERHVVTRAVADDPGHAAGRAVPVDAGGRRQLARSAGADTRMIVVEDEGTAVDRIHRAADPRVPRTEVAGRIECRWFGRGGGDLGAGPGAQLPVCRDDDPLLTQRMPALLPHRPEMLSSARGPDRRATGAVRLGRAPARCLPRGVAPDPARDPRSSVLPRRPTRRRAAVTMSACWAATLLRSTRSAAMSYSSHGSGYTETIFQLPRTHGAVPFVLPEERPRPVEGTAVERRPQIDALHRMNRAALVLARILRAGGRRHRRHDVDHVRRLALDRSAPVGGDPSRPAAR